MGLGKFSLSGGKGQALVEFALVIPIVLVIVLGIFDFGRIMITFAMASNSVRDALRMAEVIGYVSVDEGGIPPYANCQELRTTAGRAFFVNPGNVTVTYISHEDGSENVCTGASYNVDDLENGDILRIDLTSSVNFITPLISSLIQTMPINFSGQRTVVKDIDLHGITDPTDPNRDTDFDGLKDVWELTYFGNLLQDGLGDPDNDGCNNGCEETRGTNPTVGFVDTDGDGLSDGDEAYIHHTDPNNANTDDMTLDDLLDDGEEVLIYHTDPLKPDTDNDGLLDGEEVLIYFTNPFVADSDNDGLPEYDEIHIHNTDPTKFSSDEDTLGDGDEINVYGTNPLLADTDGDGVNDDLEIAGYTVEVEGANQTYTTNPLIADVDGDGLDDSAERAGWSSVVNGLSVHYYPNPANADQDGDGLNDAAERALGTNPYSSDTDGDGLSDLYERDNPPQNPVQSDSADTDGDFLPDSWENMHFGDITSQNHLTDADGDGCNNLCEFRNALDPNDPDKDDDNLLDGEELQPGPDTDGDGLPDSYTRPYGTSPTTADMDSDGLLDGDEVKVHLTDPTNFDTDGDRLKDGEEITGFTSSVTRNGITTQEHFTSDPLLANTDGADSWDDYAESKIHGTDPRTLDTDGDGLNDDIEKAGNNRGTDYESDPLNDHSDTDGLNDGDEITGYTVGGLTCWTKPSVDDTDVDGMNDADERSAGRNACIPDLPTITINDPAAVAEGNSGTRTVTFTVTMTQPNNEEITVNWATADSTAVQGQDYVAASGTVTFPAVPAGSGPQTQTFTVTINGDTTDEFDEILLVNLTGDTTKMAIQDGQGRATILNDDGPPSISLPGTITVDESDGRFYLTVSLSEISGKTVTVNYSTFAGTAHAPGDYTNVNNRSVTIPAGTLAVTDQVYVDLTVDDTPESNETFEVRLAGANNATIANGTTVVTVRDIYKISFQNVALSLNEGTQISGASFTTSPMSFRVMLDRPVTGSTPVTVNVYTQPVTASITAPFIDYQTVSPTTIEFTNGGPAFYDVVVNVYNDNWDESNETETFTVRLDTASSNAEITTPSAIGTIVDNDNTPTLTVNDASIRYNSTNTTSFTITVNGVTENPISVPYTVAPTASQGAIRDTHYTLSPNSPVTIPAGSSSGTLTLTPIFQAGPPGNLGPWNFTLTLGIPTGATLGSPSQGSGKICKHNDHACVS